MPLQKNSPTKSKIINGLIDKAVDEDFGHVDLIFDKGKLLGGGFEVEHKNTCEVNEEAYTWSERLLVFRSRSFAESQIETFRSNINSIVDKISNLTGVLGSQKRVFRNRRKLKKQIDEILTKESLKDFIKVKIKKNKSSRTVNRCGTRNGKKRLGTFQTTDERFLVDSITIDEEAVEYKQLKFGWRVYATNACSLRLYLDAAVILYRKGWRSEKQFAHIKGQPLGIRPLFVTTDAQITGLVRLLTLALQILNRIEMDVSKGIKECGEGIAGLYPGLPNKKVEKPTAFTILRGLCQNQFTLFKIKTDLIETWVSSSLSLLTRTILDYLKIPFSLYTGLAEKINYRSKIISCVESLG